jgi:hypothetical protein
MNDIETLVRESLQSTPMPDTRLADPVSSIDRRARRARALIAGGVAAVAIVVTAAVLVPMQVSRGGDGDAKLTGGPSATPSVRSTNHDPDIWWPKGSVLVASGGGSLWHLRSVPTSTFLQLFVDRLDSLTHARHGEWTVVDPADFMTYGGDRVWVWGGGDGGYPDGLLQIVDPASKTVRSLVHRGEAFTGVAFLAGSAWVATGSAVWEVDSSGRHVATVNLPGGTLEQGIVATDSGQLWVAQERSWLRIDPASHRVVDTVQWSGPMLAAAGRDAIWTYDGRLVALTPALLHQGQAAAEGSSVRVPGRVTAVARSTENGLFVVAWNGEDVSQSSGLLYYLSERTLTGTAAITRQTPFAPVSPYELAPDGAGGVNFSTSEANDEVGMHWSP